MSKTPKTRQDMFRAIHARCLDKMNDYAMNDLPKPMDERGLSWAQSMEVNARLTTYSIVTTAAGELANGQDWKDVLHRVTPRHDAPPKNAKLSRIFSKKNKKPEFMEPELARDLDATPGDDAASAKKDMLRVIEIMKRDKDAVFERFEENLLRGLSGLADPKDEKVQKATKALFQHLYGEVIDTLEAEIKSVGAPKPGNGPKPPTP